MIVRENNYLTSNLTQPTTDADTNGELTCRVSNSYVFKTCSIPFKTIWTFFSIHPDELIAGSDSELEATTTCTVHFSVSPLLDNSTRHLLSNFFVALRRLTHSQFVKFVPRIMEQSMVSCFALFGGFWFQAEVNLVVRARQNY